MENHKSIYDKLGDERKELQEKGLLPEWVTTPSYQILKEKYLEEGESLFLRFDTIAKILGSYMPDKYSWQLKFFNLLWNGYLAASTPVLANIGRSKGCPVSCASGTVDDSVYGFYESAKEAAILSKNGFGTSSFLGDIRPRGAVISGMKGSASGVLPVFKQHVQVAKDITQGNRRGAWAGYLPIDHPDFYEVINFINKEPDDANIGWTVSEDFINRLSSGDKDAVERYQKALKIKMVHGKGYFWFNDKVTGLLPIYYKDKGLVNKGSNLCNETVPVLQEDETYTCVLSSLNLSMYPKWEETQTIFESFVFLHCVALHFLDIAKDIKGLEKAVNYTRNHMSIGLGTLGWATYLQDKNIPFESIDAHYENVNIFTKIHNETIRASRYLASIFGEAPVAKGSGVANALRIAIAPNLTSALICGGVSQGIEPIYKNAYMQSTAAGKMIRVNPSLLKVMKDKGVYSNKAIKDIIDDNGSVQGVDWLTDHEKEVFKTAFEIDQRAIIRLASTRQRYIDQGQSINLFFSANEDEAYISSVHRLAFEDPYIKGLYYIRSETGLPVNKQECVACHG